MSLPSTSHELQELFVLDASAIINFLATGIAPRLLPLVGSAIAERRAFDEVRRHPVPDCDHEAELSQLVTSGHLQIRDLDSVGREIFIELTADDIAGGLDDGEAATIAMALTNAQAAVPVLDDRKAINLLTRRWPARSWRQTISLLSDERVTSSIPTADLAEAVFLMLIHARTRVPQASRRWVVELIGQERAEKCPSIGRLPQLLS
jgi:predicted nucleic acid-binding protein